MVQDTKDHDIPERFEEGLGHHFQDRELLVRALTHTSWRNEEAGCDEDNQRLEFLGDAVLELVVSEMLFHRLPDGGEGDLTRHRANLVRADRLADLARALQIGDALRLGRGERRSGGASKDSILSDAYEAVIGAVYIDGGIEAARRCLAHHIDTHINDDVDAPPPQDAKSRLQEEVQGRHRLTPRYTLVEERGPDHDKTFVVAVSVPGVVDAVGEGRSKKDAAQAAAAAAYAVLLSGGQPSDDEAGEDGVGAVALESSAPPADQAIAAGAQDPGAVPDPVPDPVGDSVVDSDGAEGANG